MDILEWISAWHADHDASRIPPQPEVDAREERATAIVQAASYIITDRSVETPKPVVLTTWEVESQLLAHGLLSAAENVHQWCADNNIPSFDGAGVRDKFKIDPPETHDNDPHFWPAHTGSWGDSQDDIARAGVGAPGHKGSCAGERGRDRDTQPLLSESVRADVAEPICRENES